MNFPISKERKKILKRLQSLKGNDVNVKNKNDNYVDVKNVNVKNVNVNANVNMSFISKCVHRFKIMIKEI